MWILIQDVIFVLLGLVGLYFGGEWLVEGASRIARSFGLSTLVIGLTVVAFGTSAPELLVSLQAALQGNSDISIGNVIGSNIANIGLIVGMTGLVFPIVVHVGLLRKEIPILIGVTVIASLFVLDGMISRFDGFLMVLGLIAFNIFMIYTARQEHMSDRLNVDKSKIEADTENRPIEPSERGREILRLLIGLGLLLIGAQLTVNGSVSIARAIGVSELVIGITLVAFGTSLPELATSLIAAFNQQSDIAIGNIVGSNIYNLLSILGITALIQPITVNERVIGFDGLVMIGFTLLLVPLVWNKVISRRESTVLLVLYFVFIGFTVLS